jgi:hypothetical protein
LSDPQAEKFGHETLKKAMLKTIEQLNIWADEAGITEVMEILDFFFFFFLISSLKLNNF